MRRALHAFVTDYVPLSPGLSFEVGDVGRCGEIWGDMGRYREIWGDMGRYGEPRPLLRGASPPAPRLARAPPRPRPIYSYPGSPSRWHGAHVPRVEASCAPLQGEPAPPTPCAPSLVASTPCAPHAHLVCTPSAPHAHPMCTSCAWQLPLMRCYLAIPPAGAAHGGGVGRDGALAADPDRQDGASRGARHPPACPCPAATAP